MTGIPLEALVFFGVLAVMMAAFPVIRRFSGEPGIRKQASKIEKRVRAAASTTDLKSDSKAPQSLRKQEGDLSLPFLTAIFKRLPNINILRGRLARSGASLSAERYLAYNFVLFLVVALLLWLVAGKPFIFSFLMGIVLGLGLPHFVVGFKVGRQQKKFLQIFPDSIDLIVRGLRAGLPVTESMKMVGREIDPPVGTVFRSISEKMALGIPLEKTLYDTAAYYRITEFDFFVTSIVLQRETGGNLSEILSNLSEALRQRLMMRMKIKAMSSEARASMYIIGVLPFVVMGALLVTSPDYLTPLFNDFRGNIAGFVAMGMLGTGMFIMTRMAKFEI